MVRRPMPILKVLYKLRDGPRGARGVAHLALLPRRNSLRDANRIGAAGPFHATPALVRGARRARMTGKSQVAKLKKQKIEGCAA